MKKFITILIFLALIFNISLIFAREEISYNKTYKVATANYYGESSKTLDSLEGPKQDSTESTLYNILLNKNFHRVLLTLALMGLVFEIFTPGFGFGGILSIICFLLFFIGTFSAGRASISSLILFIIGIILIFIEILIPGFGLPGISGLILMALGLIYAMGDLTFALISLALGLVISLILAAVLLKLGFTTKLFDYILKNNKASSERGFTSVDTPDIQIGDKLISISPLKPVGYAKLTGQEGDKNSSKKFEVISSNSYIDKNQDVVVTNIAGSKIFVEIKK